MSDVESQEKDERLAIVPDDLKAVVSQRVRPEEVVAWAQYDLDGDGHYVKGYLALASGMLGHFLHVDGQWTGDWLELEGASEAIMIDGLGISTMRLLSDEAIIGEWRFTRRHEKDVARLHRQLERLVTGKEPEPEAKGKQGLHEKKLRCEKCERVIPSWSEHCPACRSRRKILSRLLDFVKPYKKRALAGFIMAILVTAAGLSQPFLSKPMINDGLGLKKGVEANYATLMFYVALMTALLLFSAIGGAFRRRLLAKLGANVARDIRDKAYTHLHMLSLSFFSKKTTGSLVTRITSDSERIWDFVAFTLIEAFIAIGTIVGVGIAMFVLNWKLALVVLIPIPLMITLTIFFHGKMHNFFHRIFHRWSQMTAVVAGALPGVRVIKAFSQEDSEIGKFGEKNRRVWEGEMEMISLWTLFEPVLQLCSQIGVLTIWTYGGYLVVFKGMDPGTLVAFRAAMWMFYRPVHMIAHMDRMFNRAATSVQRIFEILDTPPAIFSEKGAAQAGELRGEIELRNVTFSYDGVRRVLKKIDLKIVPGEMIGLAGPSGGGKTTLINLICRFYDVLEGEILIDGIDVRDYDVQQLRRRIGVVLQEPFLFRGTVAENIAYGNPDATLDDIIRASRAANAHDFVVGFPDGYDTLVGERGQTLSGGERQRISIARAILHNPRILILDEATSSVDTESEKLIQEAIAALVKDRTTIAIAHRLSTLRRADRLVILDKGDMVECGTHEELAGLEDGLYAKLLKTQAESQSLVALSE